MKNVISPEQKDKNPVLKKLRSVIGHKNVYLNPLTIIAVCRQKDFSLSGDATCIGVDKLKQTKMLTSMP